jgi:8-oxo-dGTP diphosphatase
MRPDPDLVWDGQPFSGTKVALLVDNHLVSYRRDAKPDIPWPGLWDLPGGGREGDESPLQCGLREIEEEFGLQLEAAATLALVKYPPARQGLPTYFCVMHVSQEQLQQVRFGSEGQYWRLMPIEEFLGAGDAIPHLQHRLSLYLAT